jgi:hypothetical protein
VRKKGMSEGFGYLDPEEREKKSWKKRDGECCLIGCKDLGEKKKKDDEEMTRVFFSHYVLDSGLE